MLQMANELLKNDERLLLIEKYEADKLNKPPKNIKDATLITNYGTDEQKARLQAAQSAKAQEATENKTASPAAGASAGTGTEPAPAAEPAAPKAEDTVNSENTGTQNEGGFIEGTAQSAAEQPKAVQAADAPSTGNAEQAAAPDANQEYVKAFNAYIDVFKTMPKDTLTAAELNALVEQKKAADKKAADEAQALRDQAAQHQADKLANMVTIINNETKESTVVSRFTWDKFISKDGTHSLKPETPAELK